MKIKIEIEIDTQTDGEELDELIDLVKELKDKIEDQEDA